MCYGVIAGDVYNQATEARVRLRDLSEGFKAANCPDAASFLVNISKLILEMEGDIAHLRLQLSIKSKIDKLQEDLERTG
jgi:hypothetical protein